MTTTAGSPVPQVPQVPQVPPLPVPPVAPAPPTTLAIDIGGTGLKASVLDATGAMEVDRVRVPTTYPLPPPALVTALAGLVSPLPAYDRISAGFPGVVRKGRVLTAPHFVTAAGPGTEILPELVAAWRGFDLAGELSRALGKPAKVVNDADLQGAAVVAGHGLELVVTLGTGVGTGLFMDGHLAPHLEIAHHPFRKGQTYNEQIGDAARKRVGAKKWNRRVARALTTLDALLNPDHVYLGGGNAARVTLDLGPGVTVVDNAAGILGGIKLWEKSGPLA
ncbi:MAG: ROK family protein [Acidimicrobiales bacterium]